LKFELEFLEQEQTPSLYIPLSNSGETLESLYRTGTQQEIERGAWLRVTIRRLEAEKNKQIAKQSTC